MTGTGEAVACSVCGSPRTAREPSYYLWRERRWNVIRCRDCTHRFIHPFVSEAEQAEMYADPYFRADGDWVEGYWSLGYVEAEDKLRREAREVLDMLPRRSGRLLEIGCAGGFFLDEARRAGFDVAGIELNATMAEYARGKLGLPVVCARIEDVDANAFSEPFDVFVMMDVLEHVPEPRRLFEKADRWLAREACVLIRGPLHNDPVAELKSFVRRLLNLEKQLDGYPLDANDFSKKSLGRLLAAFGFQDVRFVGESRGFANAVACRAPRA